ncbi:hypothetical protein BC826DRAFT_976666 [Russula brevipes]|nr:hypothetical protein BC826DRAFT_976666 [Russula brevipes]
MALPLDHFLLLDPPVPACEHRRSSPFGLWVTVLIDFAFSTRLDQPIEFINNKRWYLLAWLDDERYYTAKASYAFTPDYPVLGTHEHPFPAGSPLLPIERKDNVAHPEKHQCQASPQLKASSSKKQKGNNWNEPPPSPECALPPSLWLQMKEQLENLAISAPQHGTHWMVVNLQGEDTMAITLEAIQEEIRTLCQADHQAEVEVAYRKFSLWKQLNSNKTVMHMLGQRVALALTLMEGKRVDNWVMQQTQKLIERVDGVGRRRATHTEDDEELWTTFAADFLLAFMHTASKEEAYSKLTKLTMNGYLVDEYISAYEILIIQADWDRESAGAVVLFKDGLPAWLCRCIMMRDNTPLGIRGWQEAVCEEVCREIEIQNTLGNQQGCVKGTTRQNQYLSGALNTPVHAKRKDPDTMDVDINAVKAPHMSKEERTQLLQRNPKLWALFFLDGVIGLSLNMA